MPTIKYDISIASASIKEHPHLNPIMESEVSDDRFYKTYDNYQHNNTYSDLGWSSDTEIIKVGSKLQFDGNSYYIYRDAINDPNMDGLYLLCDTDTGIQIDDKNQELRLTADVDQSIVPIDVCIYRRLKDTYTIYKQFERKEHSEPKELNKFEYIVDYVEDKTRIVSALSAPISYYSIENNKQDEDSIDLLLASLNYEHYIEKNNIELDKFLDICEFIPFDQTYIQYEGVDNFASSISTKYFPIANHVTVILKTEDGTLTQIPVHPSKDIDCYMGSLYLRDLNIDNQHGDPLGFYVFYGVVPAVLLQKNNIHDYSHLIRPGSLYSLLAINNSNEYGSERLTNQYVGLNISNFTEYAETNLYVPDLYDNFFAEPDCGIDINGEPIFAGQKKFFTNNRLNHLSLSAPSNFLNLLTPVEKISNNTFQLKNYIPGSILSIYGNYRIDEYTEKFSHLAFSGKIDPNKIMRAYGYSIGPYSGGSYSNGSIAGGDASTMLMLNYSLSGSWIFDEYDSVSLQIKPIDVGYKIILPVASRQDDIHIYELNSANEQVEIAEWDFESPDVIILNREKFKPKSTYLITAKAIIGPTLERLYIKNGIFTSATLSSAEVYPGYKGLYAMYSHFVNIRFGTKLKNGEILYFKPTLRVDLVIDKNTIYHTTSKHKCIII